MQYYKGKVLTQFELEKDKSDYENYSEISQVHCNDVS